MFIVPLIEIALGNFRLEYKKMWQVFVGMLVLLCWGALANEVFFKGYSNNYMYLKENGLPGNIGGDYYFLLYILIFVIMINLIFGIPTLYRQYTNKHKIRKAFGV